MMAMCEPGLSFIFLASAFSIVTSKYPSSPALLPSSSSGQAAEGEGRKNHLRSSQAFADLSDELVIAREFAGVEIARLWQVNGNDLGDATGARTHYDDAG